MEVKLIVDSFVEEACEAVRETGCTVGETSRDAVLGIYGAPRYYRRPSAARYSRCLRSDTDGRRNCTPDFIARGRNCLPAHAGSGQATRSSAMLGSSIWRRYTAIGAPVDLAARLCQLGASPGETVLPEHTLTHMLRTLPDGWQHIRAESEHEPDSERDRLDPRRDSSRSRASEKGRLSGRTRSPGERGPHRAVF